MKRSGNLVVSALILISLLSACGGGGGGGAATYSVGGAISGLAGTVVLQNNEADDLTITANGAFTFATKIANGGDYSVTVLTQPTGQTCTASSNTGTISGADVTNVSVVCSTNAYTVGGNVAGLSGTVVLRNNGTDDLTITANGAFTFATPVAHGAGYNVTVKTHPTGQTCTASNNTGTIAGANVTNVSVVCAVTYSIGGTVSGLSGTIVLQNNSGDNLTRTTNGPFTFPTRLADTSPYSVTILSDPVLQNCSVSNGSGAVNGANVTNVSVSCANKSWTHPAALTDNISPDGQNAGNPMVVMDNNGNAIVAWNQSFDGVNWAVFKSEYRSGAWAHPSSLNDYISPDGFAGSPRVAMDQSGDAVVVWQEYNSSSKYQIFKSEYRNNAWTHPSSLDDNISPDGQDAINAQAAMDNNGNAIIVWSQYDSSLNYQIFKSEYRNGAWTHPSSLSDNISPDGQDAEYPQVAMDDNGNAIIVWQQIDGMFGQIYKSEYRNGAWTHPSSLTDNISPDGQHTGSQQVAMDNNGNAVIVWQQSDGAKSQVFKSEYRSGAWTHPSSLTDNISPDGQSITEPQVAMDNNGNAIIVWYQSDGTNNQIFKSEYRSSAWTHPASLTDNISPDGQQAGSPMAAMDNNGNAIIVWHQSDGAKTQIFKSEYRNNAWTHPAALADNISPGGQDAYNAQAAMDNDGNAIIVWQQSDGANVQIFKSEFR